MGYILPITHYTYKGYQNRMKEKKESPHHIESVYKVTFHQITSEYDEEAKSKSENDRSLSRKRTQKQMQTNRKEKDLYYINKGKKAELTGKGGFVNAQI